MRPCAPFSRNCSRCWRASTATDRALSLLGPASRVRSRLRSSLARNRAIAGSPRRRAQSPDWHRCSIASSPASSARSPKSLIVGGELSLRDTPSSAALRKPSTSRIQRTSRSLSSAIRTTPKTAISVDSRVGRVVPAGVPLLPGPREVVLRQEHVRVAWRLFGPGTENPGVGSSILRPPFVPADLRHRPGARVESSRRERAGRAVVSLADARAFRSPNGHHAMVTSG